MKKTIVLISVLTVLAPMLLILPGRCIAGVLYVDVNSPETGEDGTPMFPYKTIGLAVSSSGDGDVILVSPGTYSSITGEVFPIQISHSLGRCPGGHSPRLKKDDFVFPEPGLM